ncbi:permease-like cell division protein FtsX [uncultured Slackia sp.]|uniref:permease-like cell division protein FtsX n=1 Tax=uncultured Slackia sp. TaxID=665903 RepID=UPI0026DEEC7D|nr:permease-like cell division protein FtsX [uncultured Slackia sp.]
MSSLIYFFKESLTGFTRNLSTALGSIVTIFLSLLIIGIFLVGGAIINNTVSSVEDKVSITAYIDDDAMQSSIDDVMKDLENTAGVASVGFTTKEQALENFQNSMSSTDIVDQLDGTNPLPASIDIELSDPQMVETIAGQLAADPAFKEICDNPEDPSDSVKYGEDSVDRLFSLTSYIRYIGVALIALLIFIALVFINNTIRLAILARRKEISIMRLVGASNGFIRGPFLMEGAVHAVIGSALAVGAIELLRRFALPQVSDALMWLPIELPGTVYVGIYGLMFVFGLVIAAIGSLLAMRRYLKV